MEKQKNSVKTEVTSEELRRAIKDIPGYSGDQIRLALTEGDLGYAVKEIEAYVRIERLPAREKTQANEILKNSEEFVSPSTLLESFCDQ